MRACYTTTIRPFIDNPGYTEEITWYFVAHDAPPIPGGTRFASGNFKNEDHPWPGPGEVLGALRVYSPGVAPYVPVVPGPAGPLDYFHAGAPWSARGTLPRRVDGMPLPCLGGAPGLLVGGRGVFGGGASGLLLGGAGLFGSEVLGGGVSWDGHAIVNVGPTPVGDGGLAWNGAGVVLTNLIGDGGLELDGAAGVGTNLPWIGDGGLQLDGAALVVSGSTQIGDGGLAWDGATAVGTNLPWIGDGGEQLDGAALAVWGSAQIGDGGSAWDGATAVGTNLLGLGDGGIGWDGAFLVNWQSAIIGDGGSKWDGAAVFGVSPGPIGDGGLRWDGAALLNFSSATIGDGGLSWDGTAGQGVSPGPIGNGGASWNGTALLNFSSATIGDGGVSWDGETEVTNVIEQPGTIKAFGGPTIPTGFLLCDGAAKSRTTYAALFAEIGTTWGAGDGSTTFNLPDLRGRVLVGVGTGSGLTARLLGATGGEETHLLTQGEMPAHVHGGITAGPTGYGSTTAVTTTYSFASPPGANSGSAGGGGSHNNMQPFACVNYMIKT